MSVSKLQPLYDRVVVKRKTQENKRPSGILIPETAQDKPMEGEVVAAGTGVRDDKGVTHPLAVKVGDLVLFTKWGGTEVKVEDQEYLIVKESDILAIIK
jgi:chaperonin GroES